MSLSCWSVVVILSESVAIIMHTCSQAISLAMIAMRKSILGFSFLSYMGMRATRALLVLTGCLWLGGGGVALPCKKEILKTIPKRYQDPVLWAWLELFFTPTVVPPCIRQLSPEYMRPHTAHLHYAKNYKIELSPWIYLNSNSYFSTFVFLVSNWQQLTKLGLRWWMSLTRDQFTLRDPSY